MGLAELGRRRRSAQFRARPLFKSQRSRGARATAACEASSALRQSSCWTARASLSAFSHKKGTHVAENGLTSSAENPTTMSMRFRRMHRIVGGVLLGVSALATAMAQQSPRPFGGAYWELDQRRQRLVDDWVTRFVKVTGQQVDARSFYDEVLPLSTKTTFEAVTNALMTTALTDGTGQTFGDALSLIERIDTVKGEVPGRQAIASSGSTFD